MPFWPELNRDLVDTVVLVSLVISILGLIAVPRAIVRIPADYFLGPHPPRLPWADAHPVLRVSLTLTKNVLGIILVLAGVAMLVLPGQGLLAILVGAMLVDFPGKRPAELALIRMRRVHAVLNWVRRRAGRDPLLVEEAPGQDKQDPAP
ncbi:MAG TPA: hypothetical protein EYQ74_12485 [Planctomycetes bacterium]|nr:hypothetical protein [Planctomycetota bacterium]HIK61805.1 hypothetical protein [Planctomycetota bacterium]